MSLLTDYTEKASTAINYLGLAEKLITKIEEEMYI
jgi:hypothetical protein